MYFTEELKDVPGGINIYSRVGMEGGNKPPKLLKIQGRITESHPTI